jgi:hypothetical protein
MKFEGPRSACQALDSIADDLGNPLTEMIEKASIPDEEKKAMKRAMEDILVNTFCGEKMESVRAYIHRPTVPSQPSREIHAP